MPSVNRCAIYARQIVTPEDDWEDGVVLVEEGRIQYLGNQPAETQPGAEIHTGHYLIPGMIDLHINGAGGGDAAVGTREALELMSRSLAAHGTTGFLPTVITDYEQNLASSLEALSAALEEGPDLYPGAVPLGIHLEGPFLSPHKRGAHRLECIQKPSLDLFRKYYEASRQKIKMVTLAPEVDGGLKLIAQLRDYLPIVSIGHSAATYEVAREAIQAGANLATHVFNAMSELHHREPGMVGAILDSEEIWAEIIADGIHVHPVVVRLLLRCKGPEKIILVTDAIAAADMPDGRHRVGNVTVMVKDGICRDAEGRLAGSTLTMEAGLKNLNEWFNHVELRNLRQVVAMATLQPAHLLGLSTKGRIQKGCDADLVLLDEDLNVKKTWVAGRLVYDSETR